MNGRTGRSWLAILLIVWAGSVCAVPAPAQILALPDALRDDFRARVLAVEHGEAQRLQRLLATIHTQAPDLAPVSVALRELRHLA